MPPSIDAAVQQQEPENVPENKEAEKPPTKTTIGIIYPPPELRNIVDKTASFVARNGPEFEARIRQNEINNSKFNFLNPGDPYHAYYQHRIKEFKEGRGGAEPNVPLSAAKLSVPTSKQAELARIAELPIIPKEPPPEYEFICDPPSISAFDLDIVKLTAQFVARNGRQFLTNLMNREQRNYQFDFLRPQHSLFNYFTKLLEQYTKILIPPKDLMNTLKIESDCSKKVLEQVRYRVEWTKQQEAQKRREAEEAERERIQYAQIDWHDFVVVETVDYQPNEQGLFPPPTNPDEVGTRVLAQQRIEEEGEEVEMEVESEGDSDGEEPPSRSKIITPSRHADEEHSDEESEKFPKAPSPPPLPPKEAPPQPPPLPPQPDQVVVRKDYNPKVSKSQQQSSEFLISPITGEKIPADKMQEHMRIGLLDPRWVEQRDRALNEKLQQEEVYAAGSAIESSLKQFAERRSDIFGIGVEETAIGKKIGEEDKKRPEKVTWDGHTASMEAATRAARANITIEEQIQQIHKIKGLLPDEEKERIGPSKPNSGIPMPSNPPVPGVSQSGTTISTTIVTSAAPILLPKPQVSVMSSMTIAQPAPPVQRPPLPPPPPPQPLLIPHQGLLTPSPGLMMTPMAPPGPPHMQHPQLIAMAPSPLGPHISQPPYAPPIPQQQRMPDQMGGGLMGHMGDDEPPNKRQKTEDLLMPEDQFLQKHKSPVTFKVQIPNISEKADWKLKGQLVTLTLPLTDMVSVMKAKLHDEIGMPPGKQKLLCEGIFIKDSNSLAFYNVMPGTVMSLQLKERGGRKK